MTLHCIFNRDDKQIEITTDAYMSHETKMDDDITSSSLAIIPYLPKLQELAVNCDFDI